MSDADLVLKNANIITSGSVRPAAGVVAVKGDRIILVGDETDLESVTGPATKVLNCEGRTLVPGFIDAHCHVFSFLRKLLSVDLSPPGIKSIEDIKAAVRRKAESIPRGQWITGTDYNDFYLVEKRHPNRHDIDEVAPDHPVVLSHRSLHACVLNSRALALAGITGEAAEPPGGHIDRELESGEPSGLLLEMLGHIREKVMPSFTDEELERGMNLAGSHYLSRGITSVQDATTVSDMGRWQKYRRLIDAGILKNRVYMMSGPDTYSQFLKAGMTSGSGDSRLRLGSVKFVPSEIHGEMHPPREELNRMVLDVHRAGFQVAIHAIRQETVEAVISAIEYALRALPRENHRHRIEHCAECPPGLLEEMRKSGVMVVTQPPFLYYSGERYLATVPPDRLKYLYRIKSLIDAGLTVSGSSDSPIVEDSPIMGIHSAVNRQAESGEILLPEERVSPGQALAMYTLNAARASFEEDIKGSISEGKLADLVLLDNDPTAVSPGQIKDIKVEMTVIGGEVVWEA